MVAATTDCVAEDDGLAHSLWMNQVRLRDIVSALLPTEGPKEGVRGPAAVDHKRIDRFSDFLIHISHTERSVRLFRRSSTRQYGVKRVNGLGAAHADLFPSNQVKFGQSGHAIDTGIHLDTQFRS